MKQVEPRPVTPLDLAFVRRVMPYHLSLDMATAVTRGISGMEDAMLSSVPLTDFGAPTVVLRHGDNGYVGQVRMKSENNSVAHLAFLAPNPHNGDLYEWVRLLEALVIEAGKRGAHLVNAEVAEDHPIFTAFRRAGFAVYARQVILRREPGPPVTGDPDLIELRPQTDQDATAISTLFANTVPRLLQQAEPLPGPEYRGLMVEREGTLAAYLALIEGKHGIVIKPYFHPEVYDLAPAIVLSALKHIPRVEQLPVYLYARAYQDWLRGALEQVEFTSWANQALMVKYTLVRVERPEFAALPGLETSRSPVADGPLPLHKHVILPVRSLWQALVHKRHKQTDRSPQWRRNGR